jgi:Protein of unknown function (DUF3579)
MTDPIVKEIFILGLTHSGRTFRPSDWAERLAGVMSPFRPGGAQNRFHPASYSPWCLPTTLNGTQCVVVHTDLRHAEPMAYDFVMNFARDNDLQTVQACWLQKTDPSDMAAAILLRGGLAPQLSQSI